MNPTKSKTLAEVAEDDRLLEIGRKAVEDALIEWREDRLSQPLRRNGLVVYEKDGTPSSLIRFGTETAVRIALKAIAAELAEAAP